VTEPTAGPTGYPAPPTELPPELGRFETEPSTQEIIDGKPGGIPMVGLVLKRTYRIGSRGGWEPVADEEQEVVVEDEIPYEDTEPPFLSPIFHSDDTLFRPRTDVVVQGSAWAPGSPVNRLTVRFRIAELRRDIVVSGLRNVERAPGGELRFTEPEPFESIPLRYDRAYGGVDLKRWLETRTKTEADLQRAMPGLPLASASSYHYPRNPAGVGFVIDAADYDPADLLVPNLEFEHDPITPSRLSVLSPERWPRAPLPAAMDWQACDWFPRHAFLGLHDLVADYAGPLAERDLGWVPSDLLATGSLLHGHAPRPEYGQGASAGMSIDLPLESLRAGVPVKLVNMRAERPELSMELPRDWPAAKLGLGGPTMTDLTPKLNAVVIRPDDLEVVMVWCAETTRSREYTPGQYGDMAAEVEWRRDPR